MKRTFLRFMGILLVLAWCACACGIAAQSDPPPSRQITLHVRVVKPGNIAVSGVAVAAGVDVATLKGTTDASGVVHLTGHVSESATRLLVVVTPSVSEQSAEQTSRSLVAFRELTGALYLDRRKVVDLVPSASEYSVTFEAQPSVAVRGHLVPSAPGSSDRAVLHRRGAPGPEGAAKDTRRFVLEGVCKSAPCDIVVKNTLDGAIREVHLTAAQTAEDFDMGDVQVPTVPAGAIRLRLKLTGLDQWPKGLANLTQYVALISSDGLKLYTFPVLARSGVVTKSIADDSEPPEIPAGTYFVVCGFAGVEWPSLIVRERIREAGGVEAVRAVGLPSLVVSPERTDESLIAVAEIMRACGSLRGY